MIHRPARDRGGPDAVAGRGLGRTVGRCRAGRSAL